MRGNMKLGKKGNYVVNIILVACVYAVIFALCKLDVKDYAKSYQDIEELLCAVSGFRMTDLPMDIQGQMIKWMLSLSVVYILVGRDIYDPLNHLKYIAMVRYGSYRRFYQTLMNKTVVNTLLYGVCGAGITYVLYLLGGNGQVSTAIFIKMSMIYILQLILLCLVQTVCMILFSGYTAGDSGGGVERHGDPGAAGRQDLHIGQQQRSAAGQSVQSPHRIPADRHGLVRLVFE